MPRRITRLVTLSATLLSATLLVRCVLPPSFEGYESAAGGTGGTGGAGGVGGTAGSAGTTAGSAGVAGTGGVSDAGSDAMDGGIKPWGAHCQSSDECGKDLFCTKDMSTAGSFALYVNVNAPSCASACDAAEPGCMGPNGKTGTCVGVGKNGACIQQCDIEFAGYQCVTGNQCSAEWTFSGFGTCSIKCQQDSDCSYMDEATKCRADGLCDFSADPQPLDDCSQANCSCYPDPFGTKGTCRIPCENDGDCPTHTASGKQMFCPISNPNQPAYGFCIIPCDNPGAADPTCDPLGLKCATFEGKDGCADPDALL
ncbi:MAG: hypothetical protein H6718_22805 [Polyangiaceae bacterium]|nr:hypothetical protein [Polyangiaceae bacterium]